MSSYRLILGTARVCTSVSVLDVTVKDGSAEIKETDTFPVESGPQWITTSPLKPNRLIAAYAAELAVYDITPTADGHLQWRELSRLSLPGYKGLAHASISNDGEFVFGADYPGGNAGSYKLTGDQLEKIISTHSYSGSGGYKVLQDAAHAHQTRQHPSNPWVYVADLGTDSVYIYHLGNDGALKYASTFSAESGTGPRHIAFHPSGKTIYVLGEVSGRVITCSVNEKDGSLKAESDVSVLPFEDNGPTAGHNRPDGSRGMHTAEILCSDDGKNIYVSNRNQLHVKDDKVSILDLDTSYPFSPKQDSLRFADAGGFYIRGMTLSPDQAYLATACQNTASVGILARDPASGDLRLLNSLELPSGNRPTCIVWQKL